MPETIIQPTPEKTKKQIIHEQTQQQILELGRHLLFEIKAYVNKNMGGEVSSTVIIGAADYIVKVWKRHTGEIGNYYSERFLETLRRGAELNPEILEPYSSKDIPNMESELEQ